MKKIQFGILSLLSVFLVTGCGGGSSGDDENPSAVTKTKGYLIDAPIVGVNYECGDINAKTITGGEFECVAAPVTFKIGGLKLGSISDFTEDQKVYLQDLIGVDRTNYTDPKLIGLARLLQALDDDGNITDAITIPDGVAAQFGADSAGKTWQELAAMASVTLPSVADAIAHLLGNPVLNDAVNIASFSGTWVNADVNTNGISKVIVASNGIQSTVHAYGKCTPSDCDWGEKSAYAYGDGVSSNLLTTTRAMTANFFDDEQIIMRPAGDFMRIESFKQFDHRFDNRSNFVSNYMFKLQGATASNVPEIIQNPSAKLSDYSGTWLNVDQNTSGTTKIILSNEGIKATFHAYGKCTPSDCDNGEVTAYAYGGSISANIMTSTQVMTAAYDGSIKSQYVMKLKGDLLQVDTFTRFEDARSSFISRSIFKRQGE